MINFDNQTIYLSSTIETSNFCSEQRAFTRPLLFVHNHSLLVFGCLLNFLAFIVLIKNSLRSHSTFAYLAFLSLSNSFLSIARFVQWLLKYYFNIETNNYLHSCRLFHFLYDFLTHFSVFTLVCVNIDRARTVTRTRPNTKFIRSTFHRILIRELIIAFILFMYHFHWLFKFGYQDFDDDSSSFHCAADPRRTSTYEFFLENIYQRIELVIFFSCPLVINLICTSIIVRSLRIRMRTAKRFSPLNQMIKKSKEEKAHARLQRLFSCFIPRTTRKSNIYSCLCFQIQCRRHKELRFQIGRTQRSLTKYEEDNRFLSQQQQQTAIINDVGQDIQQITNIASTILNRTHRIRRIRDIHLSAMLIVLNIVYLVFNLPYNLYHNLRKKDPENSTESCIMAVRNVLFDSLQQIYFCTNFFLYVLTNRRFREEFCNTMMKLFTRKQVYLLRKSLQQKQARSLSLNPSTAIITNFNIEFQTMPLVNQQQESVGTDMELTELGS